MQNQTKIAQMQQIQRQLRVENAIANHIKKRPATTGLLNVRMNLSEVGRSGNEKTVSDEYMNASNSVVINV